MNEEHLWAVECYLRELDQRLIVVQEAKLLLLEVRRLQAALLRKDDPQTISGEEMSRALQEWTAPPVEGGGISIDDYATT